MAILKLDYLIDMLISAIHLKNILIACLCTRSMFELNLLIRKIQSDKSYIAKYMKATLFDEKEIALAFLGIADGTSSDAKNNVQATLDYLQKLEQKRGLSESKDELKKINWRTWADEFNVSIDYTSIYSLASKILHITPYSLFREPQIHSSQDERESTMNLLLVSFQKYLIDSISRLQELLIYKFE